MDHTGQWFQPLYRLVKCINHVQKGMKLVESSYESTTDRKRGHLSNLQKHGEESPLHFLSKVREANNHLTTQRKKIKVGFGLPHKRKTFDSFKLEPYKPMKST